MSQLGERLREARERKGVSLEEVERTTRIRAKFLQALEEEDFAALPGETFARGFVRNYALYLGLDPQEMLALYDEARKAQGEEAPTPSFRPVDISLEPASWFSPQALISVLLVVLLGALAGWWTYTRRIRPLLLVSPTPTPTLTVTPLPTATPSPTLTPSPTPTFTPTFTPTPTATLELSVKATERTWLLVLVDGEKAFEGVLEPGDTRSWEGKEHITIKSGNAGGIKVTLNGRELGPLGGPGEVVAKEWWAKGLAPTPSPVASPTPEE